jgi:DNA-binding MarR family transcriptional regulator
MADARDAVRLSLRLLTTSRLLLRALDALMRARFGSSIARFDFMAALKRHGPLTLGEVSQHLLASNGNITQLRARLTEDGLIEGETDANDRRVQRVRLTRKGEAVFKQMAKAHAQCVDRLLGDLRGPDRETLSRLLDAAKASLRTSKQGASP